MPEPKTLSEAIERLERATKNKTEQFKDILGTDYSDLRKAVEDLKPHLDGIGSRVNDQVADAKKQVEAKVQNNPWMTLAIAGVIGLVVGWIFGFGSRKN